MKRNAVALILILILTNVFLGAGSTVTIAQEEEMSRSLPVFLLTVRGTLAASTRADAATIHNESAGSEEAIAGARALGDISHIVYLPLETPSEGAGEVLFVTTLPAEAGSFSGYVRPTGRR